jgi:hypothetical protein
LLAPLTRYWLAPCCTSKEHLLNYSDRDRWVGQTIN